MGSGDTYIFFQVHSDRHLHSPLTPPTTLPEYTAKASDYRLYRHGSISNLFVMNNEDAAYKKWIDADVILIEVIVRLVESPVLAAVRPFGPPRRPPPILEVWDLDCFQGHQGVFAGGYYMVEPQKIYKRQIEPTDNRNDIDNAEDLGELEIQYRDDEDTRSFYRIGLRRLNTWYQATLERTDDWELRLPSVVETKLFSYTPATRTVGHTLETRFLVQNIRPIQPEGEQLVQQVVDAFIQESLEDQ